MQYIIDNAFTGNVIIDLPFTDHVSAKHQFQDIEQGQRVYAYSFHYQALITSASCIHSILSKSASLDEEKRLLRLPGQVTEKIELLEYLNKQAEKAQGENRQAYNVLEQARQANKAKLEKAYKEIKAILYGVYKLARYEYRFIESEKAFYDMETFVPIYIDKKLAQCEQDTNDFVSDTKTALVTAYEKGLNYRQVEKAGYKALNAYIYDFKKTDVHYCLDDDTQTISINAMMKACNTSSDGDPVLRKAFNKAFKYLSNPERFTAVCTGYGYTLEYIAGMLDKPLTTVFRYLKKAKGKLAMLIPADAMKHHIKPIDLYNARQELKEEEEEEKQAERERVKAIRKAKKETMTEEEKQAERERVKAYRKAKKETMTEEEKQAEREKNKARQKAFREKQKAQKELVKA